MRTLAIIAAVAGAPAPGIYCPLSGETMPILVEVDAIGIDGLDCARPVYGGGRVRADRCYANGGSTVPYDTSLNSIGADEIVHEMEIYRLRREGAPCP